MTVLSNPLRRGSRGCGIFAHQNHAAGGANSSIMVVVFVSLCLASQKPSERELFIPARTNLGVKLLTKSYENFGTRNGPFTQLINATRFV
jgi:hypothetical protein